MVNLPKNLAIITNEPVIIFTNEERSRGSLLYAHSMNHNKKEKLIKDVALKFKVNSCQKFILGETSFILQSIWIKNQDISKYKQGTNFIVANFETDEFFLCANDQTNISQIKKTIGDLNKTPQMLVLGNSLTLPRVESDSKQIQNSYNFSTINFEQVQIIPLEQF